MNSRQSESESLRLMSHHESSTPWYKKPVATFLDAADAPAIGKPDSQPEDPVNECQHLLKMTPHTRRLWAALLAEFVGLMIFQIYGGNAADEVAAFGNGITLVILVYATANVSGGHLNPAVTLATCLTGHTSWSKGGLYCLAQLLGAIFGALIETGLLPTAVVGGGTGPGCFTHTKGVPITTAQLFWWEAIMTFTLVSVVFATAVTKPGHGNIAGLAVGFSLFASAFVGGPFTGAALNPARVLGPAMVFDCYWNTAFVYVIGELFGGLVAAILVLPLYGFGQFGSLFDTRLFQFFGMGVPHNLARYHQGGAHPQTGISHPAAPMGVQPFSPALMQGSHGPDNRSSELTEIQLSAASPPVTPPSFTRQPSSHPTLSSLADLTDGRKPQQHSHVPSSAKSLSSPQTRPGDSPHSWRLGNN